MKKALKFIAVAFLVLELLGCVAAYIESNNDKELFYCLSSASNQQECDECYNSIK